MTKASSYKVQEIKEMKGGFSLPEIRPLKKLAWLIDSNKLGFLFIFLKDFIYNKWIESSALFGLAAQETLIVLVICLYFFSDSDHDALEDTADARLFGLDVRFEAELDQQVQWRLSDSVLLFFLVRDCAHFHALAFVVTAFLIHEVIVAPASFGVGYKQTVD